MVSGSNPPPARLSFGLGGVSSSLLRGVVTRRCVHIEKNELDPARQLVAKLRASLNISFLRQAF